MDNKFQPSYFVLRKHYMHGRESNSFTSYVPKILDCKREDVKQYSSLFMIEVGMLEG